LRQLVFCIGWYHELLCLDLQRLHLIPLVGHFFFFIIHLAKEADDFRAALVKQWGPVRGSERVLGKDGSVRVKPFC
jgi:hypothetical protein